MRPEELVSSLNILHHSVLPFSTLIQLGPLAQTRCAVLRVFLPSNSIDIFPLSCPFVPVLVCEAAGLTCRHAASFSSVQSSNAPPQGHSELTCCRCVRARILLADLWRVASLSTDREARIWLLGNGDGTADDEEEIQAWLLPPIPDASPPSSVASLSPQASAHLLPLQLLVLNHLSALSHATPTLPPVLLASHQAALLRRLLFACLFPPRANSAWLHHPLPSLRLCTCLEPSAASPSPWWPSATCGRLILVAHLAGSTLRHSQGSGGPGVCDFWAAITKTIHRRLDGFAATTTTSASGAGSAATATALARHQPTVTEHQPSLSPPLPAPVVPFEPSWAAAVAWHSSAARSTVAADLVVLARRALKLRQIAVVQAILATVRLLAHWAGRGCAGSGGDGSSSGGGAGAVTLPCAEVQRVAPILAALGYARSAAVMPGSCGDAKDVFPSYEEWLIHLATDTAAAAATAVGPVSPASRGADALNKSWDDMAPLEPALSDADMHCLVECWVGMLRARGGGELPAAVRIHAELMLRLPRQSATVLEYRARAKRAAAEIASVAAEIASAAEVPNLAPAIHPAALDTKAESAGSRDISEAPPSAHCPASAEPGLLAQSAMPSPRTMGEPARRSLSTVALLRSPSPRQSTLNDQSHAPLHALGTAPPPAAAAVPVDGLPASRAISREKRLVPLLPRVSQPILAREPSTARSRVPHKREASSSPGGIHTDNASARQLELAEAKEILVRILNELRPRVRPRKTGSSTGDRMATTWDLHEAVPAWFVALRAERPAFYNGALYALLRAVIYAPTSPPPAAAETQSESRNNEEAGPSNAAVALALWRALVREHVEPKKMEVC